MFYLIYFMVLTVCNNECSFKCVIRFQVFTKVGVEEELMRRATELKKSLENSLRKQEHLHIDYKNRERRVVSLLLFTNYHQRRAPFPHFTVWSKTRKRGPFAQQKHLQYQAESH